MQAVGRLGSYISKSVYTVSGPFHPFGGAVDIIVVEQPDGSYKSSPWYVRFGKFQGVLKTNEKGVGISVNDVEADFHMYLDHKGEAYFLHEVDVEEGECARSPPSSSGEDTDRQQENRWPLKSKSCNYDANWSDSNANERNRNAVARTNSRRAQILGLVFGRRSMKEDRNQQEEASGVFRTDSLEHAEIAADLLELKWSTNLASPRHRKDNDSRFSVNISKDDAIQNLQVEGCTDDEQGLLSDSGHQEMVSTVEENAVEMKCGTTQNVAGTATLIESVGDAFFTDKLGIAKADYEVNSVTMVSEIAKSNSQIQDTDEKLNSLSRSSFSKEENGTDNFQAIYDSENSEISEIELEGSIEQTSLSFCNNEFGEVSFYTETVLNVTQSIPEVKSEPESDVLHGKEPLNIQEYLDKGDQFTIIHEEKISLSGENLYAASDSTVTDSYSQISNCDCIAPCTSSSRIPEEEKLLFGDLDDFASNGAKHLTFPHVDHGKNEANSSFSSKVSDNVNKSCHPKCCSSFLLDQPVVNDYMNDANRHGGTLRTKSSDVRIKTTGHTQPDELDELVRVARSLPSRWPLSNNLEAPDLDHSFKPSLVSGLKSGANDNYQLPGVPSTAENVNILKESKEGSGKHSIGNPPIDSLRGSQRSWPFSFRRSRSMKVSHPTLDGSENSYPTLDGSENSNAMKNRRNTGDLEGGKNVIKVKVHKKKVRTLTPTTEQLKSLNLKEGRNMVIFTFSTAMLGRQQVDARIFLWRWDTQIVISDVDGTITRSDLLGQFMPLVGMDWSQIGVAHLFSAIKENGYQLLFLSARSISQAFHTRQFLFNIKQDGKALPDGPVVISPDGLFPSLFREVVRRAPHEFKIACLEDIKALFPADKNPFYAGFGNRDTDEFSYLKVGIPRGKIFIINPKGEIVVNRRVDTKSYLTLYTLVHGMFPSMSSCEQEDFNSWNYWKLPPPIIDA